ncbi:FHA domain-containing protein [Planctomicrobium piriforme]|uniref:FHA domain-containing protein n=1 Tax=Planctomicrobium piriforme TaxID=1576369 RepID=UPI0015879BBC|nr:FHA domain-containing protein [Planctomicrobium piriforme]
MSRPTEITSLNPDRGSRRHRGDQGTTGETHGVRLTAVRSSLNWKPRDLTAGRYTLGSADDCDIVLPEQGVAARHCTLMVGDRQTIIKAWSPLTWINDGVVSEGTLRPGDRLILGPIELKVEVVPARNASHLTYPAAAADLQELLASSWQSDDVSTFEQNSADKRRHFQLEELLADVQKTLDEVLEREKVIRDRLSHEQLILAQRAEELSRQWQAFEVTRAQPTAPAVPDNSLLEKLDQQQRDVRHTMSLLDERHAELAARSTTLVRNHRSLKQLGHELSARGAALDAQHGDLESRESNLRSLVARNDAQQRQLKSRQTDLERREELARQQLAQVGEQQKKLDAKLRAAEEDQKHWTHKCRSRERLLDELESTITARMQDVEREEGRLTVLRSQLAEEQFALKSAITQFETQQADLKSLAADATLERCRLADERTELAASRSQLESDKSEHEQRTLGFQTREDALQTWEAERTGHVDAFQAREEALAARESELQSNELALMERQDGISEQLQQLTARREELQLREIELQKREQAFALREEAPANVAPLAAVVEVPSDSAAVQLHEELERQQQELSARHEQLTSEMTELALQKAEIEKSREELELREAQFDVEMQNLARLRGEIAAERQRDAYEREQLQQQRTLISRDQNELQAREQALEALQLDLNQREEAVRFAAATTPPAETAPTPEESAALAEIEESRQKLADERQQLERLKAQISAERMSLEQRQSDMQHAGGKLREERERLLSLQAEIVSQQAAIEEQEHELERRSGELDRDRADLIETRNELRQKLAELQSEREELAERARQNEARPISLSSNVEAVEQAATPYQSDVEEPVAESIPAVEEPAEDAAALKIRNELASMFGLSSLSTSRSESVERPAARASVPEPSYREPEPQRSEPERRYERPEPVREEPAATSSSHAGGDDESVESYMKRLLARTRGSSTEEKPGAAPASPPPKPAPVPVVVAQPEPIEVAPVVPPKKVRKMNHIERESIRADLHSFRELANHSARAAVAKSKATQKSSILRSMLMLSGIGWITAAGLLAAPTLLGGEPMLTEALAVGGVSGLLSLMAGLRVWEIKRMAKITRRQAETAPAESVAPAAEDETRPGNESPLSFL